MKIKQKWILMSWKKQIDAKHLVEGKLRGSGLFFWKLSFSVCSLKAVSFPISFECLMVYNEKRKRIQLDVLQFTVGKFINSCKQF